MGFAIKNISQQNTSNNTKKLDDMEPLTLCFYKHGSDSSDLATSQDAITSNVVLTRLSQADTSGGNGIIFNNVLENLNGSDGKQVISVSVSPRGTGWCFGNWFDIKDYLDTVIFTPFINLSGNNSEIDKVAAGKDLIMLSEADQKFYQFKFVKFSGLNGIPSMDTIWKRSIQALQVPSKFAGMTFTITTS